MKRILLAAAVALAALAAHAQEEFPARVRMDQPLPKIAGIDFTGATATLDPFQGKKTVILSFWSIFCSDCVRELDDLRAIRAEYPAEEVEIVAVNTDSGLPLSRVESFLRRYEGARGAPLDVTHILDRDFSIVNALGVRYIPLMITLGKNGNVASVLSGYSPDQDRERLGQALEQGRVALGAWSEGLRRRLRTVLRGAGPTGEQVEWGSFRVEEGMGLFGWYDTKGWLADAAGRPGRDGEKRRVEAVVRDRLKVSLLQDALVSIGLRLPVTRPGPFQTRGVEIPGAPLESENRWQHLYQELRFDDLYFVESESKHWFDDDYWQGMIAEVDLGRLRARLKDLGVENEPVRIRVSVVSDFDYKPRQVFKVLQERSYRVVGFRDEDILYHGAVETLVGEVNNLPLKGITAFAEKTEGGGLRMEVY